MITIPSQSWLGVVLLFAAVIAGASLIARLVPAYRRELHTEADTRMLALDGLRGLLCFAVLLHHAATTQQLPRVGGRWEAPDAALYIHLGKTAVALFFCITGFLFWGRVIRTNGRLPVYEFFRGRAFRVMPLYFWAALLVMAISLPALLRIGTSPAQFARLAFEMSTGGILQWHPVVTSAGRFSPDFVDAIVHWSLRYEWLFYAAVPLIAFVVRRRWMLSAMFVGSLLLLIVAGATRHASYVTMFPIGMLAAHVVRNFPLVTELRKPRYSVLIILAMTAMVVLATPIGLYFTVDPKSPMCHLLVLVMFIPLAAGNTIFGLLTLPSLRLMGTISYSVYLQHGIVLYLARPWLFALVEDPSRPNVAYWLLVAGLGVVTLVLSCITYLAIERPFILLDRNLRHKRPEPAPAAAIAAVI